MRSFTGESGARRPQGSHRFTRIILVLAWAVFWLNTALLPCCEVAAAVLGGPADNGSQSVPNTQSAHHSVAMHSEPLEHSPGSPCGQTLIAGPQLAGNHELLTPYRSLVEWFAVAASAAPDLRAVNHAAYLAPRDYHPPPPFRLYLHTQRLLI